MGLPIQLQFFLVAGLFPLLTFAILPSYLGTVSLKGSLGLGLRQSGKDEHGPVISTHFGKGYHHAPQKTQQTGAVPNTGFVASCCKGKLKLFGQNIFGYGSIKGQYVNHGDKNLGSYSPNKPVSTSGVDNYHHLHNGQHDLSGSIEKPGSGVGVVTNNGNNDEHHHHHGDHPVKFKDYNSYHKRKYPKPVGTSHNGESGDYSGGKFNYDKKYKGGFPTSYDEESPFWGKGNKKAPFVIDGSNKGNYHHNEEEEHYNHGPSSPHISDSYPPPSKDGPSYHHHHHHNDEHDGGGYNPSSPYMPPPYNQHSPESGPPESYKSPSPSFSNSIYDDDERYKTYSSPSEYRKNKGFDSPSPSSYFSPHGGRDYPTEGRPPRDYRSPPPIQVIDHHHLPPPHAGTSHSEMLYNPDEPLPERGADTKYPTKFPSFPPQPQSRSRNGFAAPQFRPFPAQMEHHPLPMIPMADHSSWMPVKGLRDATTASSLNNKDLKYRVYEYGENEVIVIDGGLKAHEKDLVRAHVYSKDGGKLLRTIEIKDAVNNADNNNQATASRRSDTIIPEEEEDKPAVAPISTPTTINPTTTPTTTITTTMTPSPTTLKQVIDSTLASSSTASLVTETTPTVPL